MFREFPVEGLTFNVGQDGKLLLSALWQTNKRGNDLDWTYHLTFHVADDYIISFGVGGAKRYITDKNKIRAVLDGLVRYDGYVAETLYPDGVKIMKWASLNVTLSELIEMTRYKFYKYVLGIEGQWRRNMP